MGNVRRRQLMGGKPKPKDIVNVYNDTISVSANDGSLGSFLCWLAFKLNAEYEVEATYSNYREDVWRVSPQGVTFVKTSGDTSGRKATLKYSGYFTAIPNPSRFLGYITKAYGGTVTVKITETIHPN